MSVPVYVCPMHADVRSGGPGTCPHCHMKLVREGTRFAILRHMGPMHIAVMLAVMLAVMVTAMMLMK